MDAHEAAGALRVAGLDVERGGRAVIRGLSFELTSGEAVLLTGPNGAGKTTLLRALAGLVAVRRGTIELSGIAADARVAEHCHYVAHANAVKLDLTVAENLTFWARFLGGGALSEDAAMREMDLGALAEIPVRYLSAGQQRRVAIGRLLVAPRRLWLMDEPAVSLDAGQVTRLEALGNQHLAAGGMIIAATHTPLGFQPARGLRLEPLVIVDGGAMAAHGGSDAPPVDGAGGDEWLAGGRG